MLPSWMIPADLAPGDAKYATRDWSGYALHHIRSDADPLFSVAFATLWAEFGAKHEMEPADLVARRLRRDPAHLTSGCQLLSELLLVTRHGTLAGVRDHTVIVRPDFPLAVVHLSHNLVTPTFRRTGIAAWLRALPVQAARVLAPGHPIALVAEMEPAAPDDAARTIRLTAYERAGYRKFDPRALAYLQPDFRDPAEIDASGGPRPLPLELLVRLVGAEDTTSLPAATVRNLVESLYRMYGADFRPSDMTMVWDHFATLPAGPTPIALIPPTTP